MSDEIRVMSNELKTKITFFTDLHAWQEAHKLVLLIYEITESFPSKEQYSLTSQMRRASVSVTSNVAEGFSRATRADRVHFYIMAQGSVTELQSQSIAGRDLGYVNVADFQKLNDQLVVTHKLLTGLIRATRIRT